MVWGETDEETNNLKTQDPTRYGQMCGSVCLMQRKAKRSKSGLSRNQSSIMPDNLREIFFIEPEDQEFKDTMENARRELEIPMPAVMPCKTPTNCRGETCRNVGKHKTKYACIVDADESMRIRLKGVTKITSLQKE